MLILRPVESIFEVIVPGMGNSPACLEPYPKYGLPETASRTRVICYM